MLRFLYQNKKLAVRVATLWTAIIFAACLIPGNEVPDVHIPLIDKYVHFVIFAGFSFLWLCALRKTFLTQGIYVFIASVGVGYAVELLQGSGITHGRSYDLYDVLADGIGGLIGTVLFFSLKKWLSGTSR